MSTLAPVHAKYLNRGVYDVREAAYLLGLTPETVIRWSKNSHDGPRMVVPEFARAFSFAGFVSLGVIKQLRDRKVPEADVRLGLARLRDETGEQFPFASREIVTALATAGRSLVSKVHGTWEDLGRGAHQLLEPAVEIDLKWLMFDGDGRAAEWRVGRSVALNPRIQAGTPCVRGSRIPTSTIADLAEVDSLKAIAADYELSVEDVRAAISFENSLKEGRGLAAAA